MRGWLGKCPKNSINALRSHPSTATSPNWNRFCCNWKQEWFATRGCVCIHVTHSACNMTLGKAHTDHQNPKRVAFYGETACVGLHPQPLHRFTPYFCNGIQLSQGLHATQNRVLRWSQWLAVEFLWWNVGFTPQLISISECVCKWVCVCVCVCVFVCVCVHKYQVCYFATWLLWTALHSETKLNSSKRGYTYPRNIWKAPPLGGSDSPLW